MSNLGKWAPWYASVDRPEPYADTITYKIAAEWLDGLAVEDWGSGLGWFKNFHNGPYLAVDGTYNKFCDVVDDLATRKSSVQGILLRHVLEHNFEWRKILANALDSAKQRIAIVVFTPNGEGQQIGWTEELGVPDLALPYDEITMEISGAGYNYLKERTYSTGAFYGVEKVWLAER